MVLASCLGDVRLCFARIPLVFRSYSACIPLILGWFLSGAFRGALADSPSPHVVLQAPVGLLFGRRYARRRISLVFRRPVLCRSIRAFGFLHSSFCLLHLP